MLRRRFPRGCETREAGLIRHEQQGYGLLRAAFRFRFDDGNLCDWLLVDLEVRHSDLVSTLSIDLSKHDVQRTNDRRHVGQQVAAAKEVHRLQMREGRGADLTLVGLVRAIGD